MVEEESYFVFFHSTLRKEAQMGKSLNGKELGKGLSQRKDGLYQGRFVNRFGKKHDGLRKDAQ